MKWHKTKVVDMNVKENMDAWKQRLFVSTVPRAHLAGTVLLECETPSRSIP